MERFHFDRNTDQVQFTSYLKPLCIVTIFTLKNDELYHNDAGYSTLSTTQELLLLSHFSLGDPLF
jgi:hypothetical protein